MHGRCSGRVTVIGKPDVLQETYVFVIQAFAFRANARVREASWNLEGLLISWEGRCEPLWLVEKLSRAFPRVTLGYVYLQKGIHMGYGTYVLGMAELQLTQKPGRPRLSTIHKRAYEFVEAHLDHARSRIVT